MSAVKGRHIAGSEPGTQNVPRNAPRSGNFTLSGLVGTRESVGGWWVREVPSAGDGMNEDGKDYCERLLAADLRILGTGRGVARAHLSEVFTVERPKPLQTLLLRR